MSDKSVTPSPQDVAKPSTQNAQSRAGPTASSALQGHVDYVDLTERVALGVTVEMPDAEAKTARGTQPLFSTDDAISDEAPEESTLRRHGSAARR